jgi:hypothetical protein
MTRTEIVQLFLILLFLVISYWWFWTWGDREQRGAIVTTKSTIYEVARTGSMLVPSLDPFIQGGSTVYIPASDGLYVTVISRLWRWRYNRGLRRWLRRGANIHLIITRPSEHCREIWQRVIDKYPLTFHLHLLNREKAGGPGADSLRVQIDRLDTFHPVLVVNSQGPFVPGAMWIEGYHPVGSKYAENVEFVHPSAATKDERLEKYNEMFERLIQGPHVTTVMPTGSQTGAPRHQRASASV